MECRNLTVSLPQDLHRRLRQQCRAMSRRTGLATRSQVVRLALIEFLERAERDDAGALGGRGVRQDDPPADHTDEICEAQGGAR